MRQTVRPRFPKSKCLVRLSRASFGTAKRSSRIDNRDARDQVRLWLWMPARGFAASRNDENRGGGVFSQFLQLVSCRRRAGLRLRAVALGFVLIYKATETVNFAQGDLMMLGAFFGLTASTVPRLAVLGDDPVRRRRDGGGRHAARAHRDPPGARPAGLHGRDAHHRHRLRRCAASSRWCRAGAPRPTRCKTPFKRQRAALRRRWCSASSSWRSSALTAALCLVLYLFFRYTKLGVAMQATSQNQLAAYYMGIPVQRVNMLIWGLAAAVAAFGGMLLAPITFVHANMGFIGLKAFPAAVVGGFGSLPGAIVGGLIIGVVEALAGFYLPEGFKDIAAYVVVLVMLLVMPSGIFGEKLREESLRRRACASSSRPTTRRTSAWSSTAGRCSGTALLGAAAARRAVAGQRVLCSSQLTSSDLRDRRPRPDAAGRLHRPVLARPCGVPRRRRLHRGAAAGAGVPFVVSLAGAALFSAAVGIVVGLPALRVKGIYLAIATLRVRLHRRGDHRALGDRHRRQQRQAAQADRDVRLAARQPDELLLSLPRAHGAVVRSRCSTCCARRPAAPSSRSATRRSRRRAWASISRATRRCRSRSRRRSPASAARSMRTRSSFISPDQFTLIQSIDLVTIVIIGGVGSLHGAFLGAIFLIMLPQVISIAKDWLPDDDRPGAGPAGGRVRPGPDRLRVFEPLGLYGRWLKIRTYLDLFPFYRARHVPAAEAPT